MIAKTQYKEDEVKLSERADDKFHHWLDEDHVSNKGLFDKAEKFLEEVGAELIIQQIVSSFDMLKLLYFCGQMGGGFQL